MNKIKNYFCDNCKQTSEKIGITQKEINIYSLDLETRDRRDLYGGESVESQDFFCINCEYDIKHFELD